MFEILQTTFWNQFSWMKMLGFRLQFDWSLFVMVELIIIQHWFGQWLGAEEATSYYLNRWWPSSLIPTSFNELNTHFVCKPTNKEMFMLRHENWNQEAVNHQVTAVTVIRGYVWFIDNSDDKFMQRKTLWGPKSVQCSLIKPATMANSISFPPKSSQSCHNRPQWVRRKSLNTEWSLVLKFTYTIWNRDLVTYLLRSRHSVKKKDNWIW